MAYDKNQTRKFRLRYIVLFKKDKGRNLLQLGQKETNEKLWKQMKQL